MSRFGLTALAATCALTVMGFSGQLASVSAEPIDLPAAKVYAGTTDLSGVPAVTPAQALATMKTNAWAATVIPRGLTACDLRCNTGFFGYR
jgi:hypothetical protein